MLTLHRPVAALLLRQPPLRRLVACILLPCWLLACSSWKTQQTSPQQVLGNEQPGKVRVTLTDGSREVLQDPSVSGDTLTGVRDDGEQVSIPLTSVSALELREGDAVKSVLLTVGILGVVAGGVYLAVYAALDAYYD